MSEYQVQTNFFDSSGTDLGKKLITRNYLFDVYPSISENLFNINSNLWTWGNASNGKLGTNDAINKSTPVTTFSGGSNWKQVSAGGFHTAAIKTDGTLWTWGYGALGRLGNNATTNRSTPVTTFAGGTNWKQVSAGWSHTSAIKTDGTLWGFGAGSSGQLGTNDLTDRSTPVTTFAGGTNWKQASTGTNFASAVKTDGTLWTWGQNAFTNLGTNDTINRLTPVTTIAGGTNWKQVSIGSWHIVAIKTDGTLWGWGLGTSGELGNNFPVNRPTPITTFAGGTNWKQVSAGANHTSAIKTDGTLWTWGYNGQGRLGTNDLTTRATPVTTFSGGTNWKQVNAGSSNSAVTAAIKTDGTLWTWGYNGQGRLGTNDIINRSTPVTTFAGGNNWKQVEVGQNHTIALEFKEII